MYYQFTLEKYRGSGSRHLCPQCGQPRKLTRYVDVLTGAYLAEYVGRCNRESKCGYHYTPKQFFIDNPNLDLRERFSEMPMKAPEVITKFDLISENILKETLCDYDRNNFIKFLGTQFDLTEVKKLISKYFIGTWTDGRTIFWQIDAERLIRTGKLMTYSAVTGKRIKNLNPGWVHAELKKTALKSFQLKQCFFGEHLLSYESEKTIAIVESEKTAIIASIFMPDLLWLATGGSGNLNLNQLLRVGKQRRTVLFPDSSKFEIWLLKAKQAKRLFNLDIHISDLLEQRLTEEQKREDYDIADFLLLGKKPKY